MCLEAMNNLEECMASNYLLPKTSRYCVQCTYLPVNSAYYAGKGSVLNRNTVCIFHSLLLRNPFHCRTVQAQ